MKAILASGNFVKVQGGVETAERLIGKTRDKISVAVINEASAVEFGDARWAIDILRDVADIFGGNVEMLNLMANPLDKIMERINMTDMVLVLGGNTDWLKIVFDKTGLTRELPKILESKLYVGNSAGAMILGHRPSDTVQGQIYGDEDAHGNETYLDLLDISILPHCFGDTDRPDEKYAITESESVNYPVHALSDNAAVIVDGTNISVIGTDYRKFQNGKVIE